MKNLLKKQKGITLVALVITVIIMLILAGVAISALITDGNIFSKTQSAVEKYNNAVKLQDEKIATLTNEMNNYFEEYSKNNTSKVVTSLNAEVVVNSSNEISISAIVDIKDGYEGTLTYSYYVNKEEKAVTEESTKVISDLTPNTSYTIYVVVADSNGGVKYSNKVTIKTKERIYLYNEGDECIELTGGWERGAYNCGSLTKETTYMNLYGAHSTAYGKGVYNSVQTVNEIDFSSYSNICFQVEYQNQSLISGIYYTYFGLSVASPRFAGYSNINSVLFVRKAGSTESIPTNEKIIFSKEITSDLKGYPTAFWANMNMGFPNSNLKIYNVWLEK